MKTGIKRYNFLAAISILVILCFWLTVDINHTLKEINEQLKRDAKNSSIYVAELIQEITSTLSSLSKAPVMATGDSKLISDFLYSVKHPEVDALVLANKEGIRWAGSSKNIRSFSIANTDFFKGVVNTKKLYITGAKKSPISGEIEFVVAYPILNKNNELEYVFYAPIYVEKFKNVFSKMDLESKGNIHLIDSESNTLLSSEKEIKKLEKYDHAIENIDKLNIGALLHINRENKEVMAYHRVEGTPWLVIVDNDLSVVIAKVVKKILLDLVIFLLVLLPVVTVFYLFLVHIELQKQELIKTNKMLQSLATTDGLTGLLNHRAFQEELTNQLNNAAQANPLTLLLLDIDNFKIFNDTYGHQTGDKVLKHLSYLLTGYFKNNGIVARYGGEEFAVILPGVTYKEGIDLAQGLSNLVKCTNFKVADDKAEHIGISIGIASYPTNTSDKENLIRFADQALYKAKEEVSNKVQMYYSALEELRDTIEDHDVLKIVYTLNTIINAKDKYTFAHSERVMNYSVKTAKILGLAKEDINNITIGALLHDIGKIEISGEILNKPSKLTMEEFEHIKNHPIIGAEIIKPLKALEAAVPFVLYHHERFDGKGYPYRLKGESIPLYGRIAAVADSFDAMTTRRPYQCAKTFEEALKELSDNAGTQFDPEIVKCFVQMISEENTCKQADA